MTHVKRVTFSIDLQIPPKPQASCCELDGVIDEFKYAEKMAILVETALGERKILDINRSIQKNSITAIDACHTKLKEMKDTKFKTWMIKCLEIWRQKAEHLDKYIPTKKASTDKPLFLMRVVMSDIASVPGEVLYG